MCKHWNWQWNNTFVYTFFVSVTRSGLVRISKTMYRWKDLSLLKLLLTNLIINFNWKPNGSREECMHMHRSMRVVYDRSRLKRVKLRSNVRSQQLQTLLGVFGQQCCRRLHRPKSLTMIKIEIHSVHFIQSINFTAGLTWKYIWFENPDLKSAKNAIFSRDMYLQCPVCICEAYLIPVVRN